MKYICISIIFFASIVEEILFYRVIFKRKMAFVSAKNVLFLVVPYIITILTTYYNAENILTPITIMVTDYSVGCIFTKTGKVENVKYWIISILIIMLLEYILLEFFAIFMADAKSFLQLNQMFACIVVMLGLWIINKVRNDKSGEEMQLSIKLFLFVTPVISIVTFFFAYMTYLLNDVQEDTRKGVGLFLFMLAAIGVCMAIVAAMHTFQQKEYFRIKSDLENRFNEQQREYFMLLLRKEEETRRFRHDIINHLLCLQAGMKNKRYDNVYTYLNEMLSEMDMIRNKQYDLGDEIVNILLNYYFLPARDKCNISIEGYLGKLENISQMDICIIFSNIFKNAEEAVEEGGNIKIVAVRRAKFAEVIIGNSYNGDVRVSSSETLETTKKDKRNHGIGLKNVQKVIRKNYGEFECKIIDNWFEVRVILPINDRSR